MSAAIPENSHVVGIIANPVSARDIRRVVTNASNIQTSERVNIVMRLLSTLSSCGVEHVMFMPDLSGITSALLKNVERGERLGNVLPKVHLVEMDVKSTVDDTLKATRTMQQAGVKAILVLGGDGTHRAVVSELLRGVEQGLPNIPICGLSTGTNNAFPEMREPTIAAMAVALYATGKLKRASALGDNKVLEISINDGERKDIAIVDALISPERFIGARAIWKNDRLHSVFLTFADPQAIGFSAIGGLIEPTPRDSDSGLCVQLSTNADDQAYVLQAPIAPGFLSPVGIRACRSMPADDPHFVGLEAGVVALDGERELVFDEQDKVVVTLRKHAFKTVDIPSCMREAAAKGLFRHLLNNQH